VDTYLAEGQRIAHARHDFSRKSNAEFIARLQRARQTL
jgi:hypothetical protein